MLFKYAPDNLFIDVYAECFVDLLSYPGSAKPRITPFQFDLKWTKKLFSMCINIT